MKYTLTGEAFYNALLKYSGYRFGFLVKNISTFFSMVVFKDRDINRADFNTESDFGMV